MLAFKMTNAEINDDLVAHRGLFPIQDKHIDQYREHFIGMLTPTELLWYNGHDKIEFSKMPKEFVNTSLTTLG